MKGIVPDWPAPPAVRALITTRVGGVSGGRYASLNLGDHVGDEPDNVARNRARLRERLPEEPRWLRQVHGIEVARADTMRGAVRADASVTREAGTVCAVLTADCLPVLLCDRAATAVAVAHAGWRGLCAGVIEVTVQAMQLPGKELLAFLGPAIGPQRYEVGAEVHDAFVERSSRDEAAFAARDNGKWLADLYALARGRLEAQGVTAIYGGDRCAYSEPEHFFSFRRDGETGRMASLIWLE